MDVLIERTNETHMITFEGTVAELLRFLHLNPETVLVSRNAELLVEGDEVAQADTLKIHSVISGG